MVMSHNNTIENNHLSENSNFGMRLHDTSDNTINNNAISGIGTGIYLDFGANRNKIINNTITNAGSGIDINFDCTNSSLKDNKISKCTFGISSHPCYNNTLTGNTISNCTDGIMLFGSKNIISKNDISYCEYGGVHIFSSFTVVSSNLLIHNGMGIWIGSDHNTIFGNTLISNDHGFDVRYCNNNTFYHNNVVKNTIQAYLVDTINEWDNGYASGGNYWSNYTSTDLFSGPYQNITGCDGIGDSAHVIDENNTDRFPLMGSISFFEAGTWDETTYYVHTVSNSTVSDFYFNENDKLVSFSVTGLDGTNGFCRVTIPKELLWCDTPEQWEIWVNNTLIEEKRVSEDAEYTYIYFTYNQSTQNVEVIGIHVIPEFPTWTSMLLLLIMLTVAIAIYKRRLLKTPIH